VQEFEFSSREHFERESADKDLFANVQMAEQGLVDIREAIEKGINTITLYKVILDNIDAILIVDLPRSEWQSFIDQSIEIFHNNEMYDDALDAWELKEELKKLQK